MKRTIKKMLMSTLLVSSSTLYAGEISGLWLGTVEVDKVNEVFSASTDADTPKEVKYPFNLQYIFHVNGSGNVKLLKEVYIMQTKDEGKRVLVTDEKRLNDFEGIIRKGDNKLVPVRFTSPSIDFETTKTEIGLGGHINTTLTSPNILHAKLHPTNPFRHQFHPNHKEGRDVTRSFKISIDAPEAGDKLAPSVGKTKLVGRYEETLLGLHKAALKVSGNIILTLISQVDSLNAGVGGGE
jgi:hypothetical protein